MKSNIKKHYQDILNLRDKVIAQKTEYVDKQTYLQAIDFNIKILEDLIFLIDSVNAERQDLVSDWFKRFRE
tara:strand:- start:131 stop:343 length:213 start_codon:yes stop_codon:yes gene_type:complete